VRGERRVIGSPPREGPGVGFSGTELQPPLRLRLSRQGSELGIKNPTVNGECSNIPFL